MQKTLNMAAGTGYVLDLGETVTYLELTAKADCWVKPAYAETIPTTLPTAAVIPGAGATGDYLHLATSGDSQDWDAGKGGSNSSGAPTTKFNHVLVWSVVGAGGELLAAGV